tara:strand:+ start:607 stop:2637 length:2031 start_codon:yes stop_codon:yes gene_type:complete
MRTIQEKYNAVLEGNFSKTNFLRDAKRELSQFLSPFNGFPDTVAILKAKGVLVEAKVEKTLQYTPPAVGVSLEAQQRGIDYELEAMGLMSNDTVTEKDYDKACKKALKNLNKNPMHYLNLIAGESKKVNKHDQMVPVNKKNSKDTFNQMKKVDLNEAKKMLKEGNIEDLAAKLNISVEALKAAMEKIKKGENRAIDAAAKKAKFSEGAEKSIRQALTDVNGLEHEIDAYLDSIKFSGDSFDSIQDYVEDFENYVADKGLEEKKGKDHDGDGDIDGDDYMMAKDKAIKGAMSEGRRRKMKGGKVVTENDYETGGYVESMGPMLDKILKQLISVWDEWKDGPATEPAMVPFAKKDLVSYIDSKITEGEDIVEDSIEEHQELKEAFKAIISKVLQEEVITEAATGNLAKIASQYSDFEGMQAAVNDLENVVTDIESYYAKTKEKIQKVYDSFRDIKNAEGLAVGAMLGPAIEAAFKKDLIPVKGFTSGLEMPKVKMLETDEIAEEDLDEKETVFTPINEALNKELKTFGPDLKKKLDSMDFQSALFNNQSAVPMEAVQKIAKNSKLAGISYFKTPDGYERIEVAVNRERIKDLEKLKSYFSTPEGQYGPDKDTGWVIKNMRNVNPGDIYVSKVGGTSNIAKITYNRAEKTGSGKFGTDQVKSTDKIAAEGKKYKYSKKK